jgi:hypothetical protein
MISGRSNYREEREKILMVNSIYGIERWDVNKREWIPQRFGGEDLNEMAEALRLLEDILPDTELRLAQYTVSEYKEIHEYS